jgi:hypothetical protein
MLCVGALALTTGMGCTSVMPGSVINVSVFPVCAIFVVISWMVKAIVSGADGSDFSAKKA